MGAPDPTRSHQILQVLGSSRFHQISPGLTRSHKVLGCSRSHQVPPGPTRSYQVLQDLQLVGYSGSHWVSPDPTRSHQILPVFGYPGCQVPLGSTKPHQQLECSRSHQVSPNPLGAPGPRSHQVPPSPIIFSLHAPDPTRSHQVPPGPPGPTVLHVTGFSTSHSSRP